MKRFKVIILTGILLLAVSGWVVFRGASDEPYAIFRASDAMVQVGAACALMTLWITWSLFVTAEVSKKRLSVAWLLALIVSALALFLLYQSPSGYVSDIVRWQGGAK